MEPISGVVPSQYNSVVTPSSLEFLPVASTADMEAVDLNVDKENHKSSAFNKTQSFVAKDLPSELKMSFHQELKRLMVRVVDSQGDTVRELPPEKYLDQIASIMQQQTAREEAREEYLAEIKKIVEQRKAANKDDLRNTARGLKTALF